ncbi:hypothetical protein PI124_g12899 [Phytophthora idaei]|nr:hypothetical protein PI125_g12549 [Phytophthora idaei]KAG3150462.1 hypothetical protein PI126_g11494 [Phytophthora idaei]KAG3242246.1 hypothetical protein PI124_g12899 [Phytophthora idaei]
MPSQEPSLLPRQEQRYVGQNVILHRGDMANTDGWVEDTFVEITYDQQRARGHEQHAE